MKKQGVFFTFIALLIVGFMVIAFTSQDFVTLKDKIPVTKSRVQQADNYVKNLKFVYLERATVSSGTLALHALSLYLNETGDYLNDKAELNRLYQEILFNGTVDGVLVDSIINKKVMEGNNLTARLRAVEEVSQEVFLINTTFQNTYNDYNVILFQSNATGPFRVGVNVTFDLFIDAGTVSWNNTYDLNIVISIEGLDDPLYMVGEQNEFSEIFTNKIRRTNISNWNTTAISLFMSNNSYNYEESAPNYLQRFYEDYTPSECCGIESLVDPVTFNHDTSEEQKSNVDWCFYTDACAPDTGGDLFKITGVTTSAAGTNFFGFKLDAKHVAIFNVTDDAYLE